ncbi:hypothetical protein Q4595_00490 [Wenyingzhuangia sp. 1_MG-2023]|nr:hypothetical protein [Wenyingzhuangia sp. 1_MG-2023]
MKGFLLLIIFLCFCSFSYGQIINTNRVQKTIITSKDTLQLENVAISPVNFKVKTVDGKLISPSSYYVNPQKGQLYFYSSKPKTIVVSYFNYPTFLTQTHSPFNKKIIIPKATLSAQTYSLKKTYNKADFFGNVNTYGNITRGITVGNGQGSVLNSGLDLQITGNLSEQLKIRASIKDSNLPIQENGVSQNIREFDRVFIELFTDKWNIKAGDVDLSNQDSYFLNFTKKINGAKLDVVLDNGDQKTNITASGALVRGKFTVQNIQPQEGNQGPYALLGSNGEQNIVVISGSETVYANGVVLKRGEQHDYVIDYNTSEITFNPTFPINSSQRIIVDFQYSDQNYNRFVTHNGVKYQNEKFTIGTYFYNETDVKNQPIQQDLSTEQKNILQQAGNDTSKMYGESAQQTTYDENRIQYTKDNQNIFSFSTDEEETLYNVSFSFVGTQQGDYSLKETIATGNIYEYVGSNNGSYAPITQLIAPSKTQMAVIKSGYQFNEKSFINTEIAYSNNDLNLFSTLDDQNNQGLATTLTWQQQLNNANWKTYNFLNLDFVQKNFKNIERLYNAEFNRDWNIDINLTPNFLGNQTYLRNTLVTEKQLSQKITFNTAYLNLGSIFRGFKNDLITLNKFNKLKINTNSSYLTSKNDQEKGVFVRNESSATYNFQKAWVDALFSYENNHQENEQTQILHENNQKYIMGGMELGVGDSTKVYSKFGYHLTQIDSVKNNKMAKVQNAQNYSIENQWIKNKNTNLTTYANYRKVHHFFVEDVNVINARTQYSQQLFQNILRLVTLYETSSGSTSQQNYTYIEVEPGQGYYTYLGDLNNNGVKDFDEFEIAQFTDQANYLRLALPTTARIATQKAKLSQSLFVTFGQFQSHNSKWLKLLSHFSNQSSILIDKDQLKDGKKFNINPLDVENEKVVGLQQNINSSLFFNRGLQHYSTTYTFQNNQNTQSISTDSQTSKLKMHEINFQHNIQSSWILASTANFSTNTNTSINFTSRNFTIKSQKINPSISFLKDEFSKIETIYTYRNEKNELGSEALQSHDFGLNYSYNNSDKGSVLASINLIENNYTGPLNTPASYRILEGLQPDRNYTWSITLQKKLTQILDLSLNYNGRKNTASNTIHIGSVQLRANF